MPEHVFVYGTLKKGGINNRLLHGCTLINRGVVRNAALFHLGGFPGLIFCRCEPEDFVRGEIYKIGKGPEGHAILQAMDRLEGRGRLYERVRVDAYTPEGHQYLCWTYTFLPQTDGLPIVEGGVWRNNTLSKAGP